MIFKIRGKNEYQNIKKSKVPPQYMSAYVLHYKAMHSLSNPYLTRSPTEFVFNRTLHNNIKFLLLLNYVQDRCTSNHKHIRYLFLYK